MNIYQYDQENKEQLTVYNRTRNRNDDLKKEDRIRLSNTLE